MVKNISIEEIQRKLKEVENTDVDDLYSEIDGTFSIMFVNGYKTGKKQVLKEILAEIYSKEE